jgi:hypothetical protein
MRAIFKSLLWLALASCSNHANHKRSIDSAPDDGRIARGALVESHEELARKAIRLYAVDAPEVYCSGVMIAPRLALSAKHCFVNATLDERGLKLSMAEFPFTSQPEKVDIKIARWTAHPSEDLALIELSADSPADYLPVEIRSIAALPKSPLILLGFGKTSPQMAADGRLRVGIVHADSIRFDHASIETSLEETEGSACPGDSGGPAFEFVDGKYFLVGITSKGDTTCSSYNKFVQPLAFLADFVPKTSENSLPNDPSLALDIENRRLRSLINWRAEDFADGGQSTLVAVVDSGITEVAAGLLKTIVPGYSAISRDSQTLDLDGHGTAVAGIIAQLAPGATLLPVKVTKGDVGHRSKFINGVVFALQKSAKVINISIGIDEQALVQIREAAGNELFSSALLVIAAGNDGHYVERFKSNWDNVIIVGATTLEQRPRLTSYSAHGPGVDIAAPAGGAEDGITTFDLKMNLRKFNGTSGAAPVVSAIAALVARKYPLASGADLKRKILDGACRFSKLQSNADGNRFLNAPGALSTQRGCENLL